MRHNPDHRADIAISEKVYNQLNRAAIETGFQQECWEINAEAVDEWVRRHNPDHIPTPAVRGYQWKSLFLPDGTLLRTVFGGKNHHCLVENDSILHNGKAVSPSGFVNAVGGMRRNAWRCTWILLPENKEWKLADSMRTRERPRRQRKAPARVGQPGNACAAGAPDNTATAAGPQRAQAGSAAASAIDRPGAQQPRLDDVEQSDPNRDANQDANRDAHRDPHRAHSRSANPLPRPLCRCGAERRSSAQYEISPLLRKELVRLLDISCTVDDERRSSSAWPSAPGPSQART